MSNQWILSIVQNKKYINNLNNDGLTFTNTFNNTSETTTIQSLNYANRYRVFIDNIILNIIINTKSPIYYEYLYKYVENELKLKLQREINSGISSQISYVKNNIMYQIAYYDSEQQITKDGICSFIYQIHCNGYCIDSIHCIAFDQQYRKLIEAANKALESTKKLIKPGCLFADLGRNNEKIIDDFRRNENYEVYLKKNSGGTMLGRYTPLGDGVTVIYAGIPKNVDSSYFTKRLTPQTSYTLAMIVSNVDVNDVKPEIISEITGCTLCFLTNNNIEQTTYNNLTQIERKIYNLIKSNYDRNIFSVKNISDISDLSIEKTIEFMIKLRGDGILSSVDGYKYSDNVRVAMVGCTIYITNNEGIVYD